MAVSVNLAFGISVEWSVAVGIGWSLAIFNLDRWLVSSYSPRTSWRSRIGAILPRLFLAVILGLAISEPLALLVFKPEVTAKVTEIRRQSANTDEGAIGNAEVSKRITALTAQIDGLESGKADPEDLRQLRVDRTLLRSRIDKVNDSLTKAQTKVAGEQDGTEGTKQAGDGPIAAVRKQEAVNLQNQIDDLKSDLKELDVQIKAKEGPVDQQVADLRKRLGKETADRNTLIAQAREANGQVDGLLIRIEALSKLSAERSSVLVAHVILALLILLIDVLPITGKALMTAGGRGSYENLLAADESEIVQRALRRILAAEDETFNEQIRGREYRRHLRDLIRIEFADEKYRYLRRSDLKQLEARDEQG